MTGILLIQLGTPDAPTATALQALSPPVPLRPPRHRGPAAGSGGSILNLFILRTRPAESAAKYARIWDPKTGSPLLHYTRRQTELLQEQFPEHAGALRHAGRQPAGARRSSSEMIAGGVERLIVLPMYPQYSATTTASATDALFKALMKERRVPALRIVPPYYDHPAYLDAVDSRHPRRPGEAAVGAGTLRPQLPRHPAGATRRRATRTRRTSSARRAELVEAAGLAARAVDADVPVALRPRRSG